MIARLVLCLLAVVAFACTSTTTPTYTPVAVCALVPNMDELVGMAAVGPPGFFSLNDVDRCIWSYDTDPARSVGVSVGSLRGHTGAIQNLGQGETAPGLGDDARWYEGNKMLSIAVGQQALQVDLQLEDGDNTKDLALAIAGAALANLP